MTPRSPHGYAATPPSTRPPRRQPASGAGPAPRATATLSVPDPNFFGGAVRIKRIGDKEWTELDPLTPNIPQQRGIGLADMMWAQRTGRPHRASATLALHVLDIMTSALASADSGHKATLSTSCERAEPMRFDLPDNTFDD